MFVFIGIAADGFFVPCLEVIAKVFGLNENVAGVRGPPPLLWRACVVDGRSQGPGKKGAPAGVAATGTMQVTFLALGNGAGDQ